MVFQDYACGPTCLSLENVAFALRRYGRARLQATGRGDRGCSTGSGSAHLVERFPGQLSGGEQQRVALARALVGNVGLVLCDEPLSNLDADLRERMRLEISTLVRESGATAVYITHDQSEAFALADRIGVLEKGHLVQMSAPETIYAAPATPFVARFTGVATEVRVRVPRSARAGEDTEVEPSGPAWSRSIPVRAIEALPVGRALLLVRPAAVRLCSTSDEACHAVGTVRDVAFRGRGYELAVDLRGAGRVSNVAASTRVARGETVGLHFEKAGCVVFESTDPYVVASGDCPVALGEEPLQVTRSEPTPASTGGRTMP